MLKILGAPHSRAFRVIWLANELGIPYEHIPVTFSVANAQCKEPWYLARERHGGETSDGLTSFSGGEPKNRAAPVTERRGGTTLAAAGWGKFCSAMSLGAVIAENAA
jgi:hypothetical protein